MTKNGSFVQKLKVHTAKREKVKNIITAKKH